MLKCDGRLFLVLFAPAGARVIVFHQLAHLAEGAHCCDWHAE